MEIGYLFRCPLGHDFSSRTREGTKICPRCSQKGVFERVYKLAPSGGAWPPPYGEIDEGCKNLVEALNLLPGVRTTECCDGHGERYLWIMFTAEEVRDLVPLLQAHKLFIHQEKWRIQVEAAPPGRPEDLAWFRLSTKGLAGKQAYVSANMFASLLEAQCVLSS